MNYEPITAQDLLEDSRDILRSIARHAGIDIPSMEYKKLVNDKTILLLASHIQDHHSRGYDQAILDRGSNV